MEIRGERECKRCGARWSYYDTGEVTCPECGSAFSVGVEDERKRHTDHAPDFDLADVRTAASQRPVREAADVAVDVARAYLRERGFIHGGDLLELDEEYLAAAELRHVAGDLSRTLEVGEDEEFHFLTLVRGADRGERPGTDDVAESLRPARGLAVASAVGDYRDDVRSWLDAQPDAHPEALAVLETLDDHVRRVEALDGDVPLATMETLVAAARGVGRALREEESDDETDGESALAEAAARLDTLE
ncbi:MAG: TFIIB-type zinc ribbon-containing protein [Haloglomus sp.]